MRAFSINFERLLLALMSLTLRLLTPRPESRVEQLKEAIAKLRGQAEDINRKISLAQVEGKIPSNQVELWMSEAKELEAIAEEIEREFEHRRCLAGWSWNCFSVNRKSAKGLDEIDKLMTGVDVYLATTKTPPPQVVEIPTSKATLGLESYMSEILGYIFSSNAEVIGIYGMGGVGKTTLLRSINNHREVVEFDFVIWVEVSRDFEIERLQMDIANRLGLHLKKNDTQENRATKLCDFLKNKKCLLLLDDVWAPLDLGMLGMVHVSAGQGEQQKRKVVVFTTRFEQVCSGMKASRKIEIKCLEPELAWELFRRHAGEDAIESDAGINRIAHQIAKNCAGLPLALVTVGMSMSPKKSWEAWNDALTLIQHSQMPRVMGKEEEDPLFLAFKLSYDNLEDDDMRGRFLSCALWPENHSIDKEELIECWMALDLIDEDSVIHKAYNLGHSYIETLKAACLLDPGDNERSTSTVKMHDVMRGMALWMVSDYGMNKFKWIVRAEDTMSQELEEGAWDEVERISLMYNNYAYLPYQLSTCSKLSVLMLQHNIALREIQGPLIKAMCALTYLNLELTGITKIPKEIGELLQLQHLNLSWTLIRELPAELGCLVKLKYLLLKDTHELITVAKGAISNLSSLKLLDLRGSKYKKCWDELERLEGCHISIGINITTATDLQCLCSLAHISAWRLNVIDRSGSSNLYQLLDNMMRSRNIRQSLEQLIIENPDTDESLISEGNTEVSLALSSPSTEIGGLECLMYLQLDNLRLLGDIVWNGVQPQSVFHNLRELSINKCNRLRNVNWVLQLRFLSCLEISHCEAMEELISIEGFPFSSLSIKKIKLAYMSKLKRISVNPLNFPCLEELEVLHCPVLESCHLRMKVL